jgi:hypothetical protein
LLCRLNDASVTETNVADPNANPHTDPTPPSNPVRVADESDMQPLVSTVHTAKSHIPDYLCRVGHFHIRRCLHHAPQCFRVATFEYTPLCLKSQSRAQGTMPFEPCRTCHPRERSYQHPTRDHIDLSLCLDTNRHRRLVGFPTVRWK